MKKISLKTLIFGVKSMAQRFPFVLFFLFGLAFYFFLQINKHGIEIQPRSWAFFSLGIALSVTVSLFSEKFKNIYVPVGANLLSVIVLLVYVLSLPVKFLPVHFYQLIILGLVFVLSAFVVSFLQKNDDVSFWEFSKKSFLQLFISFIFAQVLMFGLSLAILSLDKLFKVDIQSEVYTNLAVVCYVLFAPIYFLANVPDKIGKYKQEYSFPKFLKILGLYILLPILTIYSLILYVYLAQIIVKWELPNGWVSMLVSVLGLGGFLCMFILYPLRLENKNKVVNLLSKYFPVLLMPLLILMSVGIFRRLGDYGLTINRCYILILNIWLYGISIYLFLSESKHLKWIIISFASVALLSSVGPWSVFRITERTLVKEIGQLLTDSKLLKNGKTIDNSSETIKIDTITSKKLYEDINYVCSNFGTNGIQPFFNDSIENLDSWKINKRLGVDNSTYPESFARKKQDRETRYFHANQKSNSQVIDLDQNFKLYVRIRLSNDVKIVYEGQSLIVKYINNSFVVSKPTDIKYAISIPLKLKLKDILNQDDKQTDFSAEQLTINGEKFKFVINNVTGFYYQKSDSVTVTEMDANLFLK